eukprot:GFUD01040656.1.p1 GENE.GFUD01040656.1~~GFUD01040656.1.p1  ORF type:complete len:397 (+),score=114.55 GFUD01040656.1:155-1345(+)
MKALQLKQSFNPFFLLLLLCDQAFGQDGVGEEETGHPVVQGVTGISPMKSLLMKKIQRKTVNVNLKKMVAMKNALRKTNMMKKFVSLVESSQKSGEQDFEDTHRSPKFGAARLVYKHLRNPQVEHLSRLRAEEQKEEHWGYTGNTGCDYWGSINHNCLGISQSPINMDSTLMVVEQDSSRTRILFSNYDRVTARSTRLENNGHSVELKVVSGNPTMTGGNLQSEYQLVQLHFHWGDTDHTGSEHTINSRRFPLEMHLLHLALDIPSTQQGGMAVAGFVWDISEEDNPNIEPVIQGIKEIRAAHTDCRMKSEQFRLSSLIAPAVSGSYYSYSGSLTTPGCDEVVQWLLFSTPLTISSRQIAEFRSVLDADGEPIVNNFRPVQPLNDRTVVHYGLHQN